MTHPKQDLYVALEESVRLQSHYAKLINGYDGGERHSFGSAEEWIARLRETGKLQGKGIKPSRKYKPKDIGKPKKVVDDKPVKHSVEIKCKPGSKYVAIDAADRKTVIAEGADAVTVSVLARRTGKNFAMMFVPPQKWVDGHLPLVVAFRP